MDLSKYPVQKLLFVVASVVPGFVALLVYRAAEPDAFAWFLLLGSLGYRTKLGMVLLASLLIGVTITRFVSALVGGIEGALGSVLLKPPHMVKTAPWRDATWRATLSKVLHDPPSNTFLWPSWFYDQQLQSLSALPETQRPLATTQLEQARLVNQSEDVNWYRWYSYYHNLILFPAERDFLAEVQRGIHFNLEAAALYVLASTFFVSAVRVWWCVVPACFWFVILIVEELNGSRNAANFWSTLDRQITYLSELARAAPASQSNITFPNGPISET